MQMEGKCVLMAITATHVCVCMCVCFPLKGPRSPHCLRVCSPLCLSLHPVQWSDEGVRQESEREREGKRERQAELKVGDLGSV